jgi:hypothetical protein
MSFQLQNITLWSQRDITAPAGLPQWWGYLSTVDNVATVSAAGYFNLDPTLEIEFTTFHIGDLFYCVCTDGIVELQITALTPNITTVAFSIAAGSVTTASIANLAVTAAKIANGTITTTQISPTAAITGSQLAVGAGILGTQLTNNTITATQLALSVPQVISVPISSANFKTAFTAGIACIPAAGPNTLIVVNSVTYSFNFLTASYTLGGAVGLQYSTAAPVNAAGFAASSTVAAATVNGLAAAGYITEPGSLAIASAAQVVNQGVWLTVATQNFATGAGSVVANISYQVVTV